jgi:hypothetical protein
MGMAWGKALNQLVALAKNSRSHSNKKVTPLFAKTLLWLNYCF